MSPIYGTSSSINSRSINTLATTLFVQPLALPEIDYSLMLRKNIGSEIFVETKHS